MLDPFALPADRLVNLAYFLLVDGRTEEQREAVDRSLEQAAHTASIRLAVQRAEVATVDRRSLPPPAWWKGEEHAAELGVALMRRLDSGEISGT